MSLISLLLSYRFLWRDDWTENENSFISTTCNKQKQELKWSNNKRTQTRRHPFYTPKPDQIWACAWIYHWTINYGKSGLGLQAGGPVGLRAFGPLGYRGLLGRGPVFSKKHEHWLILLYRVYSMKMKEMDNWHNYQTSSESDSLSLSKSSKSESMPESFLE